LQLAVFAGLITVSIVACQKEKSTTQDPVEQYEMNVSKLSSESDSEAELIYDGIFDDAMGVNDEVGMGGNGNFWKTECLPYGNRYPTQCSGTLSRACGT